MLIAARWRPAIAHHVFARESPMAGPHFGDRATSRAWLDSLHPLKNMNFCQ
jgi:hypothetical protein